MTVFVWVLALGQLVLVLVLVLHSRRIFDDERTLLLSSPSITGSIYDEKSKLSVQNSNNHHSRRHTCVESHELEHLIAQNDQIFLTMPAKAAGTSLKDFVHQCLPQTKQLPDNFANWPNKSREFLTSSLELPPLIASHMLSDQTLIDLIQHTTDETLIVYLHRPETDRLLSAITEVLSAIVCGRKMYKLGSTTGASSLKDFHMENNATHCVLDETPVVDLIIAQRVQEIGFGTYDVLSCRTYQSIQDTSTNNLVVLDYHQAGRLQQMLASKYCPAIAGNVPLKSNLGDDKERKQVYLRVNNKHGNDDSRAVIKLSEWLSYKRNLLEWSLKLRSNATCQANTKEMERQMVQECSEDQALLI